MPIQVLIADLYPTATIISTPLYPWLCNEWNQLFKLPYPSPVEAWNQEKLVYISFLTWFQWHCLFFENRQKCIIMAVSRDMYCIYGILEGFFKTFIKLNQINERKKLKTWQIRNSQRRFSRAIFTSACFWSSVLSFKASLMAVLIFAKSADKLNFSMANSKGAKELDGFCFHRKYECSAMIAVTEQ